MKFLTANYRPQKDSIMVQRGCLSEIRISVALLVLVLCLSGFAGVSESGRLLDQTLSQKAMGSPTFSDPYGYNEWDFTRSPLGLFEKESTDVSLSLDFRSFSESNSAGADSGSRYSNSFTMPGLTLGKRNVMYVMLEYAPAWQSEGASVVTQKISPLHRFGLVFAAQIPSKVIRFGVSAQGYVGSESTDLPLHTGDSRTLMGVTTLAAYIGSQVHELVRIGITGGATGNIDSLETGTQGAEDRFFYGTIPVIGGSISFGKKDFPVQSNFAIDFATNNLVYVTKGIPNEKPSGNEDALLADSMSWKWETIGRIPAGGIICQPSLSLEYLHSRTRQFSPSEKNYPLTYGDERVDTNWTIGAFTFGLGTSALFFDWGRAWLEWAHENFSLSYGPGLDSTDKSRGYDRIGIGMEGNIHAIPAFKMPSSMELFLRLGYCNMRTNGRFGAYMADEFRQFNSMQPASQLSGPSSPYHVGMTGDERVSRFSFGFGATFLHRTIGADMDLGFLSLERDTKNSGVEFGFGLNYNLGVAK